MLSKRQELCIIISDRHIFRRNISAKNKETKIRHVHVLNVAIFYKNKRVIMKVKMIQRSQPV